MERALKNQLLMWKEDPLRKVLIIKGARQVGKSFLVRDFRQEFDEFVEINFDADKSLCSFFSANLSPAQIMKYLSNTTGKKIIPGKTLLFFDEIQECPDAMRALRYFYEEIPELHLIAASSLIDFVLEKIGLPVGRVETLYLYPLSFKEFITALRKDHLFDAIDTHSLHTTIPAPIHNELLRLWREYMAVGGMPEVVSVWLQYQDLQKCRKIQNHLVETFRQDFEKYAGKRQISYVDTLYQALPALVGNKFVFSAVDTTLRARELRPALELLRKAGIVHKITHSSSDKLPLQVGIRSGFFKVILSDVGLMQAMLDSDITHWLIDDEHKSIDIGAVTESFVGQEILAYSNPEKRAELFYWAREKRGSSAELDYVISYKKRVLPIEVKSGKSMRLNSMEMFLKEKSSSDLGVHISPLNAELKGKILRIPLYAVYALFE